MAQLQLEQGQSVIYENMTALGDNSYPGRVAMMGLNLGGDKAIQAYAIMGRSAGSRTRIFVDEGLGSVRTVAPGKTAEEMAKTPNAALIYYQASVASNGVYVISNGAQTVKDPEKRTRCVRLLANFERGGISRRAHA